MIAFTNAFLIDGTGREPVRGAAVVVEGRRIKSVSADNRIPGGAALYDLGGRTLMPGITDAHVHFGGPDDLEGEPLASGGETGWFREVRSGLLDHGVTNVRGAGDFESDMLRFRDMLSGGEIEGPRVRIPGKCIQARGGHPAFTVWLSRPEIIGGAVALPETASGAADEVRRMAALGVDHVKCFLADDNELEPGRKTPKLREDILRAVIAEAHALGLPAMVHCQEPADAMLALLAGADTVEHLMCAGHHGDPVPEGLAEAFVKNGAFLVPTLCCGVYHGESGQALRQKAAAVKRLFDSGVRLAVGTDTGTPFTPAGAAVHMEMALLAEAGIPPIEVIVAATRAGAELMGSDEFGTVEPGKLADLIVIDGDPLTDITCSKDIRLVMSEGRILRNLLQS